MRRPRLPLAVLLVLSLVEARAGSAQTVDWSGFIALETRGFSAAPNSGELSEENLSLAFQPKYTREGQGGKEALVFEPFLRVDQHDRKRSHFDLRQLFWQRVAHSWELRLGIGQVFWGVTESAHLVDVVNQTDLVEDLDGEDKLGQPMVHGSWIRSWGTLEFFVFPGFRPRTFPGEDGRPGTTPPVDTTRAQYESEAGRDHVDWAARGSQAWGIWDVGVSHFSGTGREPLLLPRLDEAGEAVLVPFYEQIDQSGLDLQATTGAWLWKLEAIARRSERQRFVAAVAGVELTLGDVGGSGIDLGLLAEYLHDERGDRATTPFADDLFVGARLALNDVQGTAFLAGAIVELDSGGAFLSLEGSRRLGDGWKLEVDVRAFVGIAEDDLLAAVREDDYLQLGISRYF